LKEGEGYRAKRTGTATTAVRRLVEAAVCSSRHDTHAAQRVSIRRESDAPHATMIEVAA
jgi:hypothetical protein